MNPHGSLRLCSLGSAGLYPFFSDCVSHSWLSVPRLSLSLCSFARHSLTRHQFYLQLRKDILEERLYCNDETLLQLGVLALQAEFGSYPKEVGWCLGP